MSLNVEVGLVDWLQCDNHYCVTWGSSI